MIGKHCLAKKACVEMGVNLRSRYGLVAQHILYSPQISPPGYQMCRKGMTKGMRTYCLGNACRLNGCFYNVKNGNSADPPAKAIEKKNILVPLLYL